MSRIAWLSVCVLVATNHNFVTAAATGNPPWCEYYGALDAGHRFYRMDTDANGIPPGGFAAAFSYEIAAAYYAQHSNKQQALLDLLELADYQQIFVNSDYSGQLHELCRNRASYSS